MAVKVAINGYGTIGKRAADAVTAQDDMEVVGVTKTRPTYEAFHAMEKGYPFYSALPEKIPDLEAAGLKVKGDLSDLLKIADVVIDGSPGKMGKENLEKYERAGVKAIFQGGEKHSLVQASFNSLANYSESLGKDVVRVVSCNTTGLCRTLYPLHRDFDVAEVNAVMVRRSADPRDSKRGPINAIEPVLKVPSHHGPDVNTIIPDLNINTMAVKVPTTIMHLHCNVVTFKKVPTIEEIIEKWRNTPRVRLIRGDRGLASTAQIMEFARDDKRIRSDLNEIVVWEDGAHVKGKNLYYSQAIHQESDVVPENIDAIRAMFELETDNMKSIEKTNRALGIT